jgi:hypothetical protein
MGAAAPAEADAQMSNSELERVDVVRAALVSLVIELDLEVTETGPTRNEETKRVDGKAWIENLGQMNRRAGRVSVWA